jgi:hypothetical protein
MQHNKFNKKIEQIKKISQNEKEISDNIWSIMDKFGLSSVLKPFDAIKRSGALVSSIAMSMIVLPFIVKNSVWALFVSGLNKEDVGQKDTFYELKNNSNISWRALLYGIAKRFRILLSSSNNENSDIIRALIIDDTTVSKTGKSIERVGYVHDHVSGNFVLGYKILVLGYWDGVSFIPLDFSIHREKRDDKIQKLKQQIDRREKKISLVKESKKLLVIRVDNLIKKVKQLQKEINNKPSISKQKQLTNKLHSIEKKQSRLLIVEQEIAEQNQKLLYLQNNYYEIERQSGKCGLKPTEYKNQFKKQRAKNTSGYKRVKETDKSKIGNAISMIKRALKQRFEFEYILTDSWFFSGKLLQTVVSLGHKTKLVSMAKINNAKYKILPSDKYMAPKQIIALYSRKSKTNRTYKAKYIKLQAEYQGVRVLIFFVNIGRGKNWRLLVSTDLNISFNKLMKVYKIRWTIEVFFKEAKQYLLFGKSQSQDFDAQIADTTLSFIRYILLSYYERIHYGMSIGGIFRKISQTSIEENLLADLSHIFMDLLMAFAEYAGIDFMTFYQSLIRQPELQNSITKLKLLTNVQVA